MKKNIKKNRDKIYNKYDGRCAYCGCALKNSGRGMHVDHIGSVLRGGQDVEENYNPSCISCNTSKSTYTLEEFRERLSEEGDRLRRDSAKFRLLERFGIISQTKTRLEFYYEKSASRMHESGKRKHYYLNKEKP